MEIEEEVVQKWEKRGLLCTSLWTVNVHEDHVPSGCDNGLKGHDVGLDLHQF
jgi:hypothetical protein